MKKILRILAVLILALSMAMMLAGCGGPDLGEALTDPSVTVAGQTPAEIAADLAAACLKALLFVVLCVAAKILIPFLKNTAIPFLEEKHLMGIVRILTRSAEKQGETGAIEKSQKRAYVLKWLKEKNIPVTPFVEDMIEAAVEELDKMGDTIVGVLSENGEGKNQELGISNDE